MQGPLEYKILSQVAKIRHAAVPEKFANAPELLPGLALYDRAFWDLMTCRTPSQPLPWTAITAWAAHNDITGEGFDLLHEYLREMDLAFLQWASEKREADKESSK